MRKVTDDRVVNYNGTTVDSNSNRGALAGLSVENYNGSTVNSYGTRARSTEGATYRGGGDT